MSVEKLQAEIQRVESRIDKQYPVVSRDDELYLLGLVFTLPLMKALEAENEALKAQLKGIEDYYQYEQFHIAPPEAGDTEPITPEPDIAGVVAELSEDVRLLLPQIADEPDDTFLINTPPHAAWIKLRDEGLATLPVSLGDGKLLTYVTLTPLGRKVAEYLRGVGDE